MIFINDIRYIVDAVLSKVGRCFYHNNFFSRNQVIQRYVVRNFKVLALGYDKESKVISTPHTNNTIWVFWAQGYDQMPPLVKNCVGQIDKMKGDYQLVVLDKNSFKEYVDIPEIILRKLLERKLTLTHFSDILRFALLEKYGGWWMDATIYPLHKIEKRSSLYSIKTLFQPQYISECKWSSFLWYLPAGHPMASFLSESWKKYWEENDILIEYFLIDHLVKLFYDTNEVFHREIDALPMENKYLYFMQSHESNLTFDAEKWKEIEENTKFFKCNWREGIRVNQQGVLTFKTKIFNA